jgi:hypothetical protein
MSSKVLDLGRFPVGVFQADPHQAVKGVSRYTRGRCGVVGPPMNVEVLNPIIARAGRPNSE